MRACIRSLLLAIFCHCIEAASSNTTALIVAPKLPSHGNSSTAVHIRAKRQWGGFGCCPMMAPMCCPMPMMVIPPPIPPPMMMASCCSCCLPVCMPMCITGGCGCGGGFFGRRKRAAIIQRNPVALRLTWSH